MTSPAGAADRWAWAARPRPWPPTAPAASDAACAAGNADRLKRVSLIERLRDAPASARRPVDGLVGELDASGWVSPERAGRECVGSGRAAGRRAAIGAVGSTRRLAEASRTDRARHQLVDPVEQRGGVGRHARRSRKRRRIVGRHAVDDGEARLDVVPWRA